MSRHKYVFASFLTYFIVDSFANQKKIFVVGRHKFAVHNSIIVELKDKLRKFHIRLEHFWMTLFKNNTFYINPSSIDYEFDLNNQHKNTVECYVVVSF